MTKKLKEKMFAGMCSGYECTCLAAVGLDKKEVLEEASYMYQTCKTRTENEGNAYTVLLRKQGNLWKKPK